ncbi:MAG: hypothetical protein J07HB67_00878 [halophilic archaeon J07HB67]|nr:MAG: hypothetical protein J07HB67_00878 [halophilic archaeon J07HB67]
MPSTLVHVALAGLFVAAVLPDDLFDRRAVAVAAGLTVLPDLDVFFGPVITGAHRSLGHTLLFPASLAVVVAVDLRRVNPFVTRLVGPGGGVVAGVGLFAMTVAGIGLDYVVNGVNLFWPVHDQFFAANGRVVVSNQRGVVQTFVELTPEPTGDGGGQPRTTNNTHYSTGVDPRPGDEPENVERLFPLVRSGWQLLLLVGSVVVVGARLRLTDRS